MNSKSYKYPLLNDRDWLYETYISKSLSTNAMRDIVGCKASNSVRQALIRNGIYVRTPSEGLTIGNPPITINAEMIDGCLLGDAWLFKYNTQSNTSLPYFIKKNKYIDHIKYNAIQLYPTIESIEQFISPDTSSGYEYHIFRTPVYKELMPFYNRWYSGGNRQPPDDIIITPITLLNWFMDDGCSSYRRRESKTQQVTIALSCEGFMPDKIDMLSVKLREYTDLPFKMVRCNSGCGYRISLSQAYVPEFFAYIGDCPVKSFQYKWKL